MRRGWIFGKLNNFWRRFHRNSALCIEEIRSCDDRSCATASRVSKAALFQRVVLAGFGEGVGQSAADPTCVIIGGDLGQGQGVVQPKEGVSVASLVRHACLEAHRLAWTHPNALVHRIHRRVCAHFCGVRGELGRKGFGGGGAGDGCSLYDRRLPCASAGRIAPYGLSIEGVVRAIPKSRLVEMRIGSPCFNT